MADTTRIATFHSELSRDGPGLLYRDILRGTSKDVAEALGRVDAAKADVLVLQGFDFDADLLALRAFNAALETSYPHIFAAPPNTGLQTVHDLDGDGYTRGAGDAQGYGAFHGWSGMAVLSHIPIAEVVDHSVILWAESPNAGFVQKEGSETHVRWDSQRLASVAIWTVELRPKLGPPVSLITLHAMPPGFDGPEDKNGWRNHDELRFVENEIKHLPDTHLAMIAGVLNVDPARGDGQKAALLSLLRHERLFDPSPKTTAPPGRGDETVVFEGLGPLRVDYVLTDARVPVEASGIVWPADPALEAASRHGLVWVDVLLENLKERVP